MKLIPVAVSRTKKNQRRKSRNVTIIQNALVKVSLTLYIIKRGFGFYFKGQNEPNQLFRPREIGLNTTQSNYYFVESAVYQN